jgi:hypothetical protein
LKANHKKNNNSDFESIEKVLQAIYKDPVIQKKVINLLKMDSYPRHIVLSNWLEQLRRKKAPDKLIQTLSYLFDDFIAQKIFILINKKVI